MRSWPVLLLLLLASCTAVPPPNPCGNYTAEECDAREECRPSYGPSGCSHGVCTADVSYLGCRYVSADARGIEREHQTLCEETDGVWQTYRGGGGYCACTAGQGRVGDTRFDPEHGCMSEFERCEREGGAWIHPQEISRTHNKTIPKEDCTSPSYAETWEWDRATQSCLVIRFDGRVGYCEP